MKDNHKMLLAIALASMLIGSIFAFAEFNRKAKKVDVPKINKGRIGEIVKVGDFNYIVEDIDSAVSIGNSIIREKTDGNFLLILISVANKGNRTRILDNSMFKLIDDNGTSYDVSHRAIVAIQMMQIETIFLKQCQPNVKTHGFIIFEVPRQGIYNLQLSGGFSSTEKAFVRLDKSLQANNLTQ
jgi:hypothetical protein